MSKRTRWLVRPPSMAVGALCLVLLSPTGESPGSSDRSSPCPANGGRIAVAALGETADAEISQLAGRTPYFLLFEAAALVEVVPNPFATDDRGAGAHAAYRLSELEVDCLIAGAIGPRMRNVLTAENIAFFPTGRQPALTVAEIVAFDDREFR